METLEVKISSLQQKLNVANEKASNYTSSTKLSKDYTKKMLDSMKSSYDNLCSKKEFEHKLTLCELELKFKETELKYGAKVDENRRLKEEIAS